MKKISIIATIMWAFIFTACKSRVNTYENSLGVKPSSLASIDTPNYTIIQWLDTVKNFGVVNEGDTLRVKFKFKNAGETVLYILETLPSCGCILSDYPRKPILPGEEGSLTAYVLTLGHAGNMRKNILVKSNTKNDILHRIEFYGEVMTAKK
jgi:hypothetical protein